MKRALLYFLIKGRLWGEGKSIKAKCERDAVTLIHELGGKDPDMEALFHYICEVLYLFGIGALDVDYAADRKLYAFFSKYSRTEAERFFEHVDFDKYEPSEFIVLAAYTFQKAKELKTHTISWPDIRKSIDQTESIKKITEGVLGLANKIFPRVESRMRFFVECFSGNYSLFLSEIREAVEQKITYRKK